MNIPNRFDLYFENKLSESEKIKFEKELQEQSELAELYNEYFQINSLLQKELYSPVISDEDDPILKELSTAQRLEIDNDVIRFHTKDTLNPVTENFYSDGEEISFYKEDIERQVLSNTADREGEFLKILNKTERFKGHGKVRKFRPYIGIAAAILFAFFAGKIIHEYGFTVTKTISPQQAFITYYQPRTDNELKSLDFTDQSLKSVFLDFKRSYVNSSEIFSNQMYLSDDDYELSLIYLGIIFIERNDFPEARKCFTRVLSMENPKKSSTANFYLALSFLSEGSFLKAKPILEELSKTNNYYRRTASSILRVVKNQ